MRVSAIAPLIDREQIAQQPFSHQFGPFQVSVEKSGFKKSTRVVRQFQRAAFKRSQRMRRILRAFSLDSSGADEVKWILQLKTSCN
jgi:hypothetical protein